MNQQTLFLDCELNSRFKSEWTYKVIGSRFVWALMVRQVMWSFPDIISTVKWMFSSSRRVNKCSQIVLNRTLRHTKTDLLQTKPPSWSWLAVKVVSKPTSFKEPLGELVVTTRGTLRCKSPTVKLTEVLWSFSCVMGVRGTEETSTDELPFAFSHK